MKLASFEGRFGMLGKAVDTFLPCGPWLVTPDEITDRQGLGIRCLVYGEVMQDSSTGRMIFGVGMSRVPPRWLRDGDEVTVEIERIWALTNQIRAAARNGGTT